MTISRLSRTLTRSRKRYSTRMLGGVHRPPRAHSISIISRALSEVLNLNKVFRPFIAEQREETDRPLRPQEVQTPPGMNHVPAAALARSRKVFASIEAQLKRGPKR